MSHVTRIAIWSGPRNISTAMMRAWSSRPDTVVQDEPLYSHYLRSTGKAHPGREATLAAHASDWPSVLRELMREPSNGIAIVYQKHMAHHLLPTMDRDWLALLRHAFLIRNPLEMLISLTRHVPDAEIEDTGLPQQVQLHRQMTAKTGAPPSVLDARDVLQDPEGALRALCCALDVPFDPRMLQWSPGPRRTDGAWGPYWYQEVYETTTFATYRPPKGELQPRFGDLLERCQPMYDELYSSRLRW